MVLLLRTGRGKRGPRSGPGSAPALRGCHDPARSRRAADRALRLEDAERALSSRRRRLQDRIDFLRGHDDPRLEESEAEERAVSAERRELHERADALRVRLGLEPEPPPRHRLVDKRPDSAVPLAAPTTAQW